MKKNNKGFTLVELIVVLVILGILAAILVPALLGYVDKAKEQQDVLNAKSCMTAIQAKLSELYATDTEVTNTNIGTYADDIIKTADADTAELAFTVKSGTAKHDKWTLDKVAYKKNGATAYMYFDGKSWTSKSATSISDVIGNGAITVLSATEDSNSGDGEQQE